MLKGMVNAYKIETRNASWLYSLFWYPAVVAKGRYILHIWYAGKSCNQLLIPCRSDMKLTSDWYQTLMHRVASGLIMAWPERGGVYDSWQMGKMVDQIAMKFTRIAHCTQRNSHICKHLHKNWWCQYLPFVSETPGHRWFPLTKEQWCRAFCILIVVRVNRLLN